MLIKPYLSHVNIPMHLRRKDWLRWLLGLPALVIDLFFKLLMLLGSGTGIGTWI
jgi:hypothetical protein